MKWQEVRLAIGRYVYRHPYGATAVFLMFISLGFGLIIFAAQGSALGAGLTTALCFLSSFAVFVGAWKVITAKGWNK
jgi:hypothetical protein